MLHYLADYDWGRLDISDPEQVVKKVEALLIKNQEQQFWEVPWASSYDTKSGRALIVESLIQISRNIRTNNPWYADVELVDITQLETKDRE